MPPLALPIRFNFSVGTDVAGYTTVRRTDLYTAARGYGYNLASPNILEVDGLGANPDDLFDEVHAKLLVNNIDLFRIDLLEGGLYDVIAWIGHPTIALTATHLRFSFNSGSNEVNLSVVESTPANVFLVRGLSDRMTDGEYMQIRLGIVMGAPRDSALAIFHINKIEGLKAKLTSLNAVSQMRVP